MNDYRMLLMPYGGTAFFKDGEQVPEIQGRSWIILQFEELQRHGIDPREVQITGPGGVRITAFVTSEGKWNWTVHRNHHSEEERARPMPLLT